MSFLLFSDQQWSAEQKSICKIWGFHDGDHEDCRLLGRGAVYILCEPTFRRNYLLHLQGKKLRERGASVSRWLKTAAAVCSHLLTMVLRLRIILPWRRRRYVPLKRRFTQDLHGATPQKTAFFKNRFNFQGRVVTFYCIRVWSCTVCAMSLFSSFTFSHTSYEEVLPS
jgi:hypothetical protein